MYNNYGHEFSDCTKCNIIRIHKIHNKSDVCKFYDLVIVMYYTKLIQMLVVEQG